MNTSSVTQAYATLGLQPGCSWEEVRKQYKRLAFAWHPDRHVSTPDPATIEERAKEINAAFDVLSNYYRAQARAEYAEPGSAPRDGAAMPDPPDAPEPLRTAVPQATPTYVIAAAAISALVFWLFARPAAEPESDSRPATNAQTANSPTTGNTGGSLSPLRVGASAQEVLQRIGVPAKIAGDTWYYDAGQVFFRNGVVTNWQVAADAEPGQALSLEKVDERVTYGSTREDVRRILGAPAAEGDTQWTYGPSQIYFANGRVSGWYISPLQPLKVRK